MLRRFALGLVMLLALSVSRLSAQHAATPAPSHAPAGATHAPEAAHGDAAGGHGRDHEVIEFDAATAVWVLIIFLVLLIVLYPTAWKGVLAGLKAREERIRKDIADAEATRAKAEQTLRDYNQKLADAEQSVRDMLSKATVEAQQIGEKLKAAAQEETEALKARAQKDIEAAKEHAIAEVYDQAAVISTQIAEKIIRRTLNADDQRDLVKQSLEQLQTIR